MIKLCGPMCVDVLFFYGSVLVFFISANLETLDLK